MKKLNLVLALGSNLENRKNNLKKARTELYKYFELVKESSIYENPPVDYLDQPSFLNQVIQVKTEIDNPVEILKITQLIEERFGREKTIDKGPRIIDIDVIHFEKIKFKNESLTIPHESWDKRSFVLIPYQELPFFREICHNIQDQNLLNDPNCKVINS